MSDEEVTSKLARVAAEAALGAAHRNAQQHETRFLENLERVEYLLSVYQFIADEDDPEILTGAPDVLRAAVVFLHASLEDFLRSVATVYFPIENSEYLKKVPLIGLKESKFTLDNLNRHSGASVDELVRNSIVDHLNKISWSSCTEIAKLLENLGLDPSNFEKHFESIQNMIDRRHSIVHRADRSISGMGSEGEVQPIVDNAVMDWITTTTEFVSQVKNALVTLSLDNILKLRERS